MITIYSAIYGGYDKPLPIFPQDVGYKFIMYTDNLFTQSGTNGGWEIRHYHSEEFDALPVSLKSRYIKTHSHELIEGPSLWIDGNIMFNRTDALRWISEQYTGGVLSFKHPIRNSIVEEMDCLKQYPRFKHLTEQIDEQKSVYIKDGYKFNNGLSMSGILYRDNTPEIAEFNELRWEQIKTYCTRDQLSFQYCIWKLELQVEQLANFYKACDDKYFKIIPHKYDISIVLPVFNEIEYTQQVIKNIEDTQGDLNYELIIINDGSSDWTQARLNENWKGHWKLVEQENKGVTYSWNLGVEMASADYIAIINNDVFIEEGCFKNLIAGFDDPEVLVVCPRFTQRADRKTIMHYEGHLHGFFYVINKKAKELLFPIDSRFRIFGNDRWLYHKMIYMGYKLRIMKDVIIHHFLSQTVLKPGHEIENLDIPVLEKIACEEGRAIRPIVAKFDEPEGDLFFGL